MQSTPPRPSLRDLLLASDFGRAHPDKVELLLNVANYCIDENAVTLTRYSDDCPLPERVA